MALFICYGTARLGRLAKFDYIIASAGLLTSKPVSVAITPKGA